MTYTITFPVSYKLGKYETLKFKGSRQEAIARAHKLASDKHLPVSQFSLQELK